MKQLIFIFLTLFTVSLAAQDYDYEITPVTDSTYRLVITDKSSGTFPYDAKDYGVLSQAQLQRTIYEIIEGQYNAIGEARAYDFFQNLQITRAGAALQAINLNNYETDIDAAISRQFDGIYRYTIQGTATDLNVRIENLQVTNASNGNPIGTIDPKSRRFITVVTQAGSFNLYTTNDKLYVGRNLSDQISVLRKVSGLPQPEQP